MFNAMNSALTSARPTNGRRPVAEALENRRLLTSVIVNTLVDATGLPNALISLREAIATANASTTPTAITFSSSVFSSQKTLVLSHGVLELKNVKESTTITGPAAGIIISGNKQSGVFQIDAKVTASLSNLTITNGTGVVIPLFSPASTGGGINSLGNATLSHVTVSANSAVIGGGIFSDGTLKMVNSTISGNAAKANAAVTAGLGGGITLYYGAATVTDCTISGNTATAYGGGVADYLGNAIFTNVTISGNSCGDSGGGIDAGISGPTTKPSLKLTNCTISGNTAKKGGGIYDIATPGSSDSAVVVANTIVAGNSATTAPDYFANTPVDTFGNNLIGKTDGSQGWSATDLTGTIAHPLNANLGPLANNGGPTQTMLPLTGSATINAGLNALVPSGTTTDQRGLPRISGSKVDIGAVEVQIPTVITGTVFDDANKNGKKDSTESGLAGWKVYDDVNNNGKFDAGEAFTFTIAGGAYTLPVTGTGTATIRQVNPANWSQTSPASNAGIKITLSPGSTKSGNNFGDYTAVNYLSKVATTSGLVAWWTFDSSSQANSVVNGYTGSLIGGAKISGAGGGEAILGESSNTGLVLNGTSAYVNTNLTTQQEFKTAATINVWINLGSTPASGHVYSIAAKSQFGNDLDLQVEADGTIHFYTDSGTSASFKPTSLTGWHMITAEFDTTARTRQIWWDSSLVANMTPYNGVRGPSTQAFSIGNSDVFGGRFFDGTIDELSLWNVALTSSQIGAIYTAATGRPS